MIEVIYPADLTRCQAIRKEVFVDEQNVSLEEELDGLDELSTHFLVMYNGEDGATGRLRESGHKILFERIASKMKFRGHGLGKTLLLAMMDEAKKSYPLLIPSMGAQKMAMPFYKKHGWVALNEPYIDANIEHDKMILPARFSASKEALPEILNWIEAQTENKKLQLICEEVVVNIISHAYPNTKGELEIHFCDDKIRFVDSGAAFDPTKAVAPDTTLPLEQREPGGLGIEMIKAFAKELSYERQDNKNILTII